MAHYITLLVSLLFCFSAFSEEDEAEEKWFTVREHTLTVDEKTIDYVSVAGRIPLYNDQNEESARIFFLAFTKKCAEPDRPLTFVFPGGPGGSCTLEAICGFGPERLPLPSEGKPKRPPYFLQPNLQTLLFETDLVYVDPVETGYSEIFCEDDVARYHTASGDIDSLTQFVSSYLSLFQRWNAPLFLSGISYGTTRACGVGYNLTGMCVPVQGLILLGSAIDFDQLDGKRNHFLPDCLLLPTYAATAWYHKKLWPDKSIQEVIEYARSFAYDEYAHAMAQPSRLDRHQKEYFFKRLAEITGLDYTVIQRYNGRINEEIFTTEFLAPERKILGGLDTRYQGDQSAIKRRGVDEDPSYREETKGITSVFLDYLEKKIGYQVYQAHPFAFGADHVRGWFYDLTDLLYYLRRALVMHPDLKIFSGNGYYDCRTPFAATEYCFEHLDLAETYRNNVTFKYYEAGHALIFDEKVLKQLHEDLTCFYKR